MDDRRLGLVLRALRRRRRMRQADLAVRVGCSQATISRAEAGHLDTLTLRQVRLLLAALDVRLELVPFWRGAALDRLLDEAHAELVAAAARRLEIDGWSPNLEVTYSEYGERGSIDILGLWPKRRAAAVCEIKSDIASTELIGRKLDEKVRLAPGIVKGRFGWLPVHVARILVLPDTTRLRRIRQTPTLRRLVPGGSRDVRQWLRDPTGPLAAVWFLPNIPARNAERVAGPRRVASVVPPPTTRARGIAPGPSGRLTDRREPPA